MRYHDLVVVFVSYLFVHVDDRMGRDPAKRAASLIKAMLPFRELTERYMCPLCVGCMVLTEQKWEITQNLKK